jgi:hypothetical protein
VYVNDAPCSGKAADEQRWATTSIIFVEMYENSAGGKLSVTERIHNEKSQSQLATVPLYFFTCLHW